LTENPVTVTVLVPCRNEEQFIDRCLASIFAFEAVPGGFEVVVVDGLSEDKTAEKLAAWSRREGDRLRVLTNPSRAVPAGLNLGIRAARGRLILRVDAHSAYPPDYLRLAVETSDRTKADNVGGLVKTIPAADTLSARLVQYMTTHRFGVGNSRFRLGSPEGPIDTVPFGCFRREIFARIGWFDERLVRNQDYEFNRRILRSGGTIWCNPAIEATYYNRASVPSLLSQAWHTGRWNPWMWYLAPYAFAARHVVPAAFVCCEVLLLLASGFSAVARWALLAVNGVYACVALWVAFRHARRESSLVRALLAACFFAYHFAYGSGILAGAAALIVGRAPVQQTREPWQGAGRFRAWPSQA